MKKLLFVLALLVFAAPALAGPYVAIPAGWVNFDGNGHFDQTIPGAFDGSGLPLPVPIGAEVFGVGTISGVAMLSDLGSPVWLPSYVGPNFEMTYSFWDAVVVASGRVIRADPIHPGHVLVDLWASYTEEARVVLVSDTSKDFNSTPGPVGFDLVTGDYATAYTLPAGGAAVDPGESLYLDLMLSNNSSLISWSSFALQANPISFGFLGGSFTGFFVEILGGYGASSFMDDPNGPDGSADAFIINFSPLGWAYGADTDIQLQAVPEPAALMSLCAGLALLSGYALRKRS